MSADTIDVIFLFMPSADAQPPVTAAISPKENERVTLEKGVAVFFPTCITSMPKTEKNAVREIF